MLLMKFIGGKRCMIYRDYIPGMHEGFVHNKEK
jgi:hypothetical protein